MTNQNADDFFNPCLCKGKNNHCPVCGGRGFIGFREGPRLEPGEEWFPRSMARGRLNAANLDRDLFDFESKKLKKKRSSSRRKRKGKKI